jgi:hypothetical protein
MRVCLLCQRLLYLRIGGTVKRESGACMVSDGVVSFLSSIAVGALIDQVRRECAQDGSGTKPRVTGVHQPTKSGYIEAGLHNLPNGGVCGVE